MLERPLDRRAAYVQHDFVFRRLSGFWPKDREHPVMGQKSIEVIEKGENGGNRMADQSGVFLRANRAWRVVRIRPHRQRQERWIFQVAPRHAIDEIPGQGQEQPVIENEIKTWLGKFLKFKLDRRSNSFRGCCGVMQSGDISTPTFQTLTP